MAIPEFQSFLCGCSLELGSRMAALFLMLEGILLTVNFGLQLSSSRNIAETSVFLIIALLIIIFSIVLLVGLKRKSLQSIRVWLFVNTLITVLLVSAFLLGSITSLFHGEIWMALSTLILTLFGAPITIYFILVVYSYMKQLEAGN